MQRISILTAATLLACVPIVRARAQQLPTGQAQDACTSFVGQTIQPKTIDAVIARFATLTPKTEFETTAQYEARKASAVEGATGTVIISKDPGIHPDDSFKYDADAKKLRIMGGAFYGGHLDISALYAQGLQDKIDVDSFFNIEVVIYQTDDPTGTYQATNGYGAVTQVQEIHRVTKAIFDRKANDLPNRNQTMNLFPNAAPYKPYVVGTLDMSSEDAQRVKPKLKIAFVVTPKAPFLIKGTYSRGNVTRENPVDRTEDFAVLVADIHCALVTDAANRVLGAYPTR